MGFIEQINFLELDAITSTSERALSDNETKVFKPGSRINLTGASDSDIFYIMIFNLTKNNYDIEQIVSDGAGCGLSPSQAIGAMFIKEFKCYRSTGTK